jgi:tetratricopeptide (TPR) repeat protein
VLLEAARLATEPETSRTYAARVIDRTRSDELLEAAYMLRGDSFFAEGRYVSASAEYANAARHSRGRGPGIADLKRARSILASGDAGEAVEAYREIAEWGATPNEMTPHAEVGLARALLVLGRFTEAAEQFELTARVYEDSEVRVRALAGAADARESSGGLGAAVEALRAIVDDYPESYEAVLAREKLRTLAAADTTSLAATPSDSSEALEPEGRAEE